MTLLSGFIDEIGLDKAMVIALGAIQKEAIIAGRIMAEKYGGNSIKEHLRNGKGKGGTHTS